ncbi:MAG: hypothetical protein Q8K02_08790 [Flavobacterium sp.]|nr:hypothetical protein [Flavobacterium sp.]
MKIGINNIFTFSWFILMLLTSGTLTYFSYVKNVFTSDVILVVKLTMVFMILLFTGMLFFTLYKFRILFIYNNRIISITPFLMKIEKVDLKNVKRVKWSIFHSFKSTFYREVEITGPSGTISFSDLEFENFDSLTDKFTNTNNKSKKEVIDLVQAKSNLSSTNFNIYLLSGFLLFLIFNTIFNRGFNIIIVIFHFWIGLFLYASIKRKMKYRKIIKTE